MFVSAGTGADRGRQRFRAEGAARDGRESETVAAPLEFENIQGLRRGSSGKDPDGNGPVRNADALSLSASLAVNLSGRRMT
jgi:hypothetical protein